jgi:hypothetical protein
MKCYHANPYNIKLDPRRWKAFNAGWMAAAEGETHPTPPPAYAPVHKEAWKRGWHDHWRAFFVSPAGESFRKMIRAKKRNKNEKGG